MSSGRVRRRVDVSLRHGPHPASHRQRDVRDDDRRAQGRAAASRRVAFVQSEWYLGPQNEPSSLSKAAAGAPSPDYVVFNGVANQYVDNPIEIGVNKRVRAFVLNAGPNIDSSFHIVGTIFDTVIKEGISLTPRQQGPLGLAGG